MTYSNDDLVRKDYSPTQKSLIIGSLLGDGSLYWQKGCRFPRFIVSFSKERYPEYAEWKKDILVDFRPGINDSWSAQQLYLSPHPYFTELYQLMYVPKPKHLNEAVLDYVDELALAVWFMDDGSYIKHAGGAKLSTHGYSCQEHILMQDWFLSKWGIEAGVRLCETGLHCLHFLEFSRVQASGLADIIGPYVIPSMRYKLGL